MSKTVHPFSFRLGVLRNWRSRWFNSVDYKKFLKADVTIREYLVKLLKGMYVDMIEIERSPAVLHVIVKTSRPGLVIGRKGEGAEKIRAAVLKIAQKNKLDIPREIKISIEELASPESHARIVGQMIVEGLEKRMPFKRIMKQTLEKVMANKDVKGVKIALSGRLGGADMSRREWLRKGRIPLQTLRADIDFARETAAMPYGAIGVKTWVYRGDKNLNEGLETKNQQTVK